MANLHPSDVDLVNFSAAIYDSTSQWDYYDNGDDDYICVGIKKLDGCDVVAFRGSITAHDWVEDLRAAPIKTRIGTVHAGFYNGMEKAWLELEPHLTQPVYVTGHSLGAARADMLVALMVVDGKPPARRAVFGEPRPGMTDFAKVIAKIPGDGYRNGNSKMHDLVTDVPLKLLPPFNFVHPTDLVHVDAEPSGILIERLGLFAYHHIELYQAAVTAHFKE